MVLKLQVNIWASICTLLRLDLRRLCWTGLERFRISSNVNKKRITRSLNKTGFRSCESFKMNTNYNMQFARCNLKVRVQFATCTMQEARCNLQSLIRRCCSYMAQVIEDFVYYSGFSIFFCTSRFAIYTYV